MDGESAQQPRHDSARGIVLLHASVSLEGFIAGPEHEQVWLFEPNLAQPWRQRGRFWVAVALTMLAFATLDRRSRGPGGVPNLSSPIIPSRMRRHQSPLSIPTSPTLSLRP